MNESWLKLTCPSCSKANWRYMGHEMSEDDPPFVTECWSCNTLWVEEGAIDEFDHEDYDIGEGRRYATVQEWAQSEEGRRDSEKGTKLPVRFSAEEILHISCTGQMNQTNYGSMPWEKESEAYNRELYEHYRGYDFVLARYVANVLSAFLLLYGRRATPAEERDLREGVGEAINRNYPTALDLMKIRFQSFPTLAESSS